jgi:metal-responsive CopG/Arc/MetJ family transcriptional regulator
MTEVILGGMKTAISIPDELFAEADRVAKRLRVSRSELYAKAVDAYVRKLRDAEVTERLNLVYAGRDSRIDPVLAKLQERAIAGDDDR